MGSGANGAGDAWTMQANGTWSSENDTVAAPTDAYGKLEFSGTGQKISDVSNSSREGDTRGWGGAWEALGG